MLVESYLTRARDFFKGVDFMDGEAEVRYSSALLAIHCAISYSDALRCGLGSKKLAAYDHQSAPAEVKKLLDLRKYARPQGVRHLEKLLRRKTFVSYSHEAMTQEEAKSLVEDAKRFVTWANKVGADLQIEGWRNDGA